MYLTSLDVRDVRNIVHASISPGPGFNLFYGLNGAGKTSLLESIAILSTGRSFRAGKIGSVIRSDQDSLIIAAEIRKQLDSPGDRIGLQRGRQETTVRINGQTINKISALAQSLPCVIVSTSNHELIEGGPSERRSFLDWLLFHVEPDSLVAFQRYRSALQQRNAALKSHAGNDVISMWHPELAESGNLITEGRQRLLKIFQQKMSGALEDWPSTLQPSFHYRSGWSEGTTLNEALERLDQCRRRGITSVGPHRADLSIKSAGQESRYVLSRGQQKLLAAQMRMIQIEIFSEHHNHSPVVLFDDLPSELDKSARQKVFQYLYERNAQVFLTSVDDVSEDLQYVRDLFHVEQGKIEKVI